MIFDLQLDGFYSQPTSQTANQPTKQPAKETIHPDIPTSLGPGAGGPKAIRSAAPAGVPGVFKIICPILPTTKTYSLTKPTDLYGLLLVESGLNQSARGG